MHRSLDRPESRISAQCKTTRWSLIVAAKDEDGAASRDALAQLCRIYWYPLYAFARRRGFDADSAADLIQSFFCEFVDGRIVRSADRDKGRFRSYLLGALKHFISAHRDRCRAQKRGGGVAPLSLNNAELHYGLEPAHNYTPERLYERRWALTLLELACSQLEREYTDAGKTRQFEQLKDLIAGPLPDRSYADIANDLQMTEGAVKVAVHRMRRQFRAALASQIAETVATSREIEDEIRHLYAVISDRS
jgi:RNA polymerase sigma-70 factor (ECF subfamily)